MLRASVSQEVLYRSPHRERAYPAAPRGRGQSCLAIPRASAAPGTACPLQGLRRQVSWEQYVCTSRTPLCDTPLGKLCCSVTGVVYMVWCGVCGVVYGIVWPGVVWCGMLWCGMLWYSVAWCDVVWCSMVCYGTVWCGLVWCGVVCYGAMWYSVVWYGMMCATVQCGTVWCGLVWYGVWYGMMWCGTARCGTV